MTGDQIAAVWWAGDPADLVDAFRRPVWWADAACRGHDIDLWFPRRGGDTRPAVAICRKCPVRPECLAWALEQDTNPVGIFGGLTQRQRRTRRGRDRDGVQAPASPATCPPGAAPAPGPHSGCRSMPGAALSGTGEAENGNPHVEKENP